MERKDIEKLSELARIGISDSEKDELTKDLNSILSYIGELKEVSLDMEETPKAGELRNVFREDEDPHEEGVFSKDLVSEMPESVKNYLKVKKIL